MGDRERCENIVLQVRVWWQELYQVASRAEHFHSLGGKFIEDDVRDLMVVLNRLRIKIDELQKTCPEGLEAA